MKKLPTAEKFALNDNWEKVIDHVTIKRMIEFAKLHVEAALESASKKIEQIPVMVKEIPSCKKIILDAYPLENIK